MIEDQKHVAFVCSLLNSQAALVVDLQSRPPVLGNVHSDLSISWESDRFMAKLPRLPIPQSVGIG